MDDLAEAMVSPRHDAARKAWSDPVLVEYDVEDVTAAGLALVPDFGINS